MGLHEFLCDEILVLDNREIWFFSEIGRSFISVFNNIFLFGSLTSYPNALIFVGIQVQTTGKRVVPVQVPRKKLFLEDQILHTSTSIGYGDTNPLLRFNTKNIQPWSLLSSRRSLRLRLHSHLHRREVSAAIILHRSFPYCCYMKEKVVLILLMKSKRIS